MRSDMKYSIVAVIAGLAAATPVSADCPDTALDASRIGWSSLQFHAAKFFFSVDTEVTTRSLSASDLPEILITTAEGRPVQPDGLVQEIAFATDAFGRHTIMSLLVNADSGAALQRTTHDSGGRYRHRVYRFTDKGAYHKTRWPVGKTEEKLPADRWEEWSEAGEDLRPYPHDAVGELVTDPSGLLYIVGAAKLDQPGDHFEILTYVRKHVHRVHIEVTGTRMIKVNYKERQGANSKHRKDKKQALRLLIRGEPLDDGDDQDEFELLGLRGNIEMLLDPVSRAPLQLTGKVKIAGKVTMRITELVRMESAD